MGLGQITRKDVGDFQRSLRRVAEVAGKFRAGLTPREKLVLQLGLRAAHWEEALAAGDMGRAADHERAVLTIAQALSIPESTG